MKILSQILIILVAVEHLYILWIEMFVWLTLGRKTFRSLPADMFEKTKTMAANQGLYNGFLAAGLFWSILISDTTWSNNVAYFFVGCVITAGLYGGATVGKSVFIKQAVPAIVALLVTLLTAH